MYAKYIEKKKERRRKIQSQDELADIIYNLVACYTSHIDRQETTLKQELDSAENIAICMVLS